MKQTPAVALPKTLALYGLLVLLTASCRTTPPNSLASHNSSRWQKDIATFQAMDATNHPPAGCIVFVGSSSIRLWKTLVQDFPGQPVVNRGFGGSQLADSVNYANQIIMGYKPRQVVIYGGSNDINSGKEPELVFGDFVALVSRIREGAPKARICFIAVAPNPARWAQVDKFKKLNSLIENYCRRHGCSFIDVFPLMLGTDGLPKPDIFVADRLHMNSKGYAIWRDAVVPYVR